MEDWAFKIKLCVCMKNSINMDYFNDTTPPLHASLEVCKYCDMAGGNKVLRYV